MSVVGFDLGNSKCKVAIARRGGIDIAVNDVSNRETPSLVSFSGHERFMGEKAATQAQSNFKNTVGGLMRLVGKQFDSPEAQAEIAASFVSLKQSSTGGVEAEVQYEDKTQIFKVERLLGMLLSNLRSTAETELKTKVVDCVLTVPTSFRVAERQAVLDAAKMIGLNPLCLINSTTAAALQWGFYRQPEEGQIICICDCGHSSFDVAIVQYHKDKLTVLGVASSTKAAGAELDNAITRHLVSLFKQNFKVDASTRPRALVRVQQAAERTKRTLSANPQCPVNIECLMDDVDVRAMLTREEVEELWKESLSEVAPTVQLALDRAGVNKSQVSAVEVIGGQSWIPAVSRTISEVFGGMTVSRTLNASEAVAKGACLQCAMLSLTLKVREYSVNDICPYGIAARWDNTDGSGTKTVVVFDSRSQFPNRKLLTFIRDQPFDITVGYADDTDFKSPLLKCRVSGMKEFDSKKRPHPDNEESANPNKVKVTIELTKSCTVAIDGAQLHEEYEVEVPIKEETTDKAATATATATPAAAPADAAATPATPAAEQATPAPADATATPVPMEVDSAPKTQKKTKVRKTPIGCDVTSNVGLSTAQIQSESDAEYKLVAKDREIKATQDAKNGLETYVYEMRDKVADSSSKLSAFIEEKDRSAFLTKLNDCENWLYSEDCDTATKATFTEKLAELTVVGDAVEARFREFEQRPAAFEAVEQSIRTNRETAQSLASKYEHIPKEERDKCLAKADEIEATLAKRRKELEAQPKSQAPVHTTQSISALARELDSFCSPIMNKPKPAPPAQPAEEAKPAPADAAKPADAQAEPTQPTQEGDAVPDKMDVVD
eukprot:c9404_g1_i1.p1 GENE.c9404_g1_i1~~c9404_g1_i1.p1  ORF type:complete len:857 (+),score=224.07 c9404_g1_i1:69-2573(+)